MDGNDAITEEIEALLAILPEDEILVHNDESNNADNIEVIIKPTTGHEEEKQHVRVTLVVSFPQNYPEDSPNITFKDPKGIDDEILAMINEEIIKKCNEYIGLPVIYELIVIVQENLTANNAPKCPCAICLFHFTQSDSFKKTECFHYFHSYCLGRYIDNCNITAAKEIEEEGTLPSWISRKKREVLCPICREPINIQFDFSSLLNEPHPEEEQYLKDFIADSEMKDLQKQMTALFEKQKAQGGIIDIEKEKNRYLISVPTEEEEEESRAEATGTTPNIPTPVQEKVSHNSSNKTKNVHKEIPQKSKPSRKGPKTFKERKAFYQSHGYNVKKKDHVGVENVDTPDEKLFNNAQSDNSKRTRSQATFSVKNSQSVPPPPGFNVKNRKSLNFGSSSKEFS